MPTILPLEECLCALQGRIVELLDAAAHGSKPGGEFRGNADTFIGRLNTLSRELERYDELLKPELAALAEVASKRRPATTPEVGPDNAPSATEAVADVVRRMVEEVAGDPSERRVHQALDSRYREFGPLFREAKKELRVLAEQDSRSGSVAVEPEPPVWPISNEANEAAADKSESASPDPPEVGNDKLTAPQVAMTLFEYACQKKDLDPLKRGSSRPAFNFLIELAELPNQIESPVWLDDKNFDTFSSYLTKARKESDSQIYGGGHGVETRSVKHHKNLDRPIPTD